MAEDNDFTSSPDTKSTPSPDAKSTKVERRRPGRVDYQNPHLIRLLRGEFSTKPPEEELFNDDGTGEDRDDLRTFQGIMIAVWISLIMWFVIIELFM